MTVRGPERFHFNGPDIRITSGAVIALAMTFNELCTNTTKFGALSVPGAASRSPGRSTSRSSGFAFLDRTRRPGRRQPKRRSFGTRMMESLGQQLNGQVQLGYEPSGFVYSLDVPLSAIVAAA